MKRPSNYIKIFILFCLPINTALAGEIFSSGFESGSLDAGAKQQNGFFWGVGKNTSVSTTNSNTGSYSLKLTYLIKNDNGYSNSEQPFELGGNYPELWLKYDLYVPSNYYHEANPSNPVTAKNNKGLANIWGGSSGGAGRNGPKLATHFFPTGTQGASNIVAYASARQSGDIALQRNWNNDDGVGYFMTPNDEGHWMTVVLHLKYATIANNDGVYEIWKTDWQGKTTQMINIHDGNWYSTQDDGSPATGFDKGYLLGWANAGYAKETIFYIDNITFSTTPLTDDYVAAPKPPTIISSN